MNRVLVAICLAALLIISAGCDSPWLQQLATARADTEMQRNPVDVQSAIAPLWDSITNHSIELPKQIKSLPIFMGEDYIDASTIHSNVILIVTGSGDGHWGLLVTRPGSTWAVSEWHRERITHWGDGVYFYSEFRWVKPKWDTTETTTDLLTNAPTS